MDGLNYCETRRSVEAHRLTLLILDIFTILGKYIARSGTDLHPVTIGVSIYKYPVSLAGCCAFVAGAIAIVRFPEAFAATIHGRGAGLLHLARAF
jgi:hypothetical protein